jgi:ATP-dependent DNA helicase DinG
MRDGKVVLSECGTGSGKSRIIAHAAAYALRLRDNKNLQTPPDVDTVSSASAGAMLPEFIRKYARQAQLIAAETLSGKSGVKPVIICAPSIENISHLVREWIACAPHLDLPQGLQLALALGRAQFVDGAVLVDLLDSSDTSHPGVEKWVKEGMPAGLSSATSYLSGVTPVLCGLMSDLAVVSQATDFPYSEAVLDESSSSESSLIYETLRQQLESADIIFTTQALICLDNLTLSSPTRSGLLPSPCAVLVDEAHELETTQANMAGSDLSFLRLGNALADPFWAKVRKASTAASCAEHANEVVSALKHVPDETTLPITEEDTDTETFRMWLGANSSLQQLSGKLKSLIKGVKTKELERQSLRAFRAAEKANNVLDKLADGYRGFIERSPVQGRIRFQIGPSTVEKYLAARWETTPTAVLLSGTLMHIAALEVSPRIFARSVAISASRLGTTAPIHPAWVTDSATLVQPSKDCFHQFVPPRPNDTNPLSLSFWLNSVATAIDLAAARAVGGMLVLMTGYERLDILAKAIVDRYPEIAPRLVIQQRDQGVIACASVFKAMARRGERPIWLAVGAAWTGLDMADEKMDDKNSQLDLLLTDLVIPALPFGLDKTTTHVSRVKKIGFTAESIAAQRRLRQALGRLVRREGLLHRKIWLLDGRLQLPGASVYTAPIKRVLLAYIHTQTFDV